MSLGDHLRELRRRFLISAITLLAGAVLGWIFYERVYDQLAAPFNEYKDQNPTSVISLNFGNATAAFSQQVSLSIFVGVLLSSPVWLYQLWAFITPGLTRQERRLVWPGLVAAGFALNFLVRAASVVNHLISRSEPHAANALRVDTVAFGADQIPP